MSKIKLTHTSGNSMSIAAPGTDPGGHLELKLPATIGTANQALTNSSTPGTLAFKTLPFSEFDQWYLTQNKSSDGYLTNFARSVDTWPGSSDKIGTGMSVASDVWTFPSTGIWLVVVHAQFNCNDSDNVLVHTEVTTNNSSYTTNTNAVDGNNDSGGGNKTGSATSIAFLDVTNTTNVKVKFLAGSVGSGSAVRGTTNTSDGMQTNFNFIRIGDT